MGGQQVHEIKFSITNHQGNANQNHSEVSPHSCKNGCYQKQTNKETKNNKEIMPWQRCG